MWRDRGALRGGSSVRVTTAIRGLASYPYRMPYRPPPRAPYMYAVTPPPGPGPGGLRGRGSRPGPARFARYRSLVSAIPPPTYYCTLIPIIDPIMPP